MKTHTQTPERQKGSAHSQAKEKSKQKEKGKSLKPPSLQLQASSPPPPLDSGGQSDLRQHSNSKDSNLVPIQRQVAIQRNEDGKDKEKKDGLHGDANINVPKNTFEYNYEFAKRGNLSGSIRFTVSPANAKLIELEGGYKTKHEDATDFEPANAKSKVGFLESKTSFKKSHGKKTGMEMAAAMAKVDILELSPFEWLKVSFDMKAFEAKMKANAEADKKFEVALAKISGNIKGVAPSGWLESIGIPKEIAESHKISISGKLEYKVPFEDLAKLREMHKATRELTKQTQELAKKVKAKDMIETRNQEINRRVRELKDQKKQLNHGGKKVGRKERDKLNKQIKEELKELRAEKKTNGKKLKSLKKGIKDHKKLISKADDVIAKASKGLKSKSGRLVGKVIQKVGGKIAGKIIAKLIPGLNIISTIADLAEVSYLLYKLANNEAEIGLGGGEGGGKKGEEGTGGSGGEQSEGTEEKTEGTGGESKTGGEGKKSDQGSGGDGTGTKDGEGKTDTSTKAGVPDFNKIDPNDASLYEPVKDPFKQDAKPPKLSPQAKKVIEALKGSGEHKDKATRMKNSALRELNEVIPESLTDEEVQELINRLKSQGGPPAKSDPDALIGRVMSTIEEIQTGAPQADVMEEVKEVNYEKAGIANKNWQANIGWTVEELSGQSGTADSKEFIDYIAEFQSNNGINGGGIAGPRTVIAILNKLGKTDSPAYDKAKAVLAQEASDERQGKGGDGSGTGEGGGGSLETETDEKQTDTSSDAVDKTDVVPDDSKDQSKGKEGTGGPDKEGSETKTEGSEQAEAEPEKVVNDRPEVFNAQVMKSCLEYNEKTKVVSLNQKQVEKIRGMGKTDSYGMGIEIKSFTLSVKPIKVGDEIKYYRITGSMNFDVSSLPQNAGDQYPYAAGQNYTESMDTAYDIDKDQFQNVSSTQYERKVAGLLQEGGSGAMLKPGVQGTVRDLGELKAKINKIVNQVSMPKEGGGKGYIVEVEVTPTELKTISGVIRNGKLTKLAIGEPFVIKTMLVPETETE